MNNAGLELTSAPGGVLRRLEDEPFYRPTADEVEVFATAAACAMPVLLKGPTGCGKTRLVEHMAWRLGRPLVTVACHDDLSAADLVGRYLIADGATVWTDGPLTQAVRAGAICYLDEIAEARRDTTVVIHPLADDRRLLPLEKRGELLAAAPGFLLVMSYNPGAGSLLKELKPSTRQRFVTLELTYPDAGAEAAIVIAETGIDLETAEKLVRLAAMTRNLCNEGLDEGASTRLLVHAARLVRRGLDPRRACLHAVAAPLSDDPETARALSELVSTIF